jgi:hypothetical protein
MQANYQIQINVKDAPIAEKLLSITVMEYLNRNIPYILGIYADESQFSVDVKVEIHKDTP